MNEPNNEPLALFLAFCVIGAMYGIITLIGMLINLNSQKMINTSINLRDAAIENINTYCKNNNCENDFNLIKKDLINQADEYNLKLPIDFYKDFYNLTVDLLKEQTKKPTDNLFNSRANVNIFQ